MGERFSKFEEPIPPVDTRCDFLRYKSLDFLESDNEEVWKSNLSKYYQNKLDSIHKKIIEKYLDEPIEYKYNNFGFRSDFHYIEKEEANFFLGCSMTEGIGLHLEETYVSKLSKILPERGYMFAQGGTGIDSWCRILYQYSKVFKPKRVFILWNNWPRYEFFSGDKYIKFSLGADSLNKPTFPLYAYREFFRDALSDFKYINYNFDIKLKAIKFITQELNIPLYLLSQDEVSPLESWARDLAHFGDRYQTDIANKFLKLINIEEGSNFNQI